MKRILAALTLLVTAAVLLSACPANQMHGGNGGSGMQSDMQSGMRSRY